MSEACAWGASEHGCDVDVRIEELFRGYRIAAVLAGAGAGRGGPAPRRPRARAGLRPAAAATPTRCVAAGFDCVLLANGTDGEPHRRGERRGGAASTRCSRSARAIVRGGGGVSGAAMLKLRRGVVVEEAPLTVEVDGERRPAWADRALLGEMREGDEVVVNVEALDLGLGSGGFDVVHVNLTRGPGGRGRRRRARDEAQLHLAPAPGRPGRAQRGGGGHGRRSGASRCW